MQRSDFIALSAAIRAARDFAAATRQEQAVRGVELAACVIADALAAQCGQKFEHRRFLADAGVSAAAERAFSGGDA